MRSILFASISLSLALSVPAVAVAKDAAAPEERRSQRSSEKTAELPVALMPTRPAVPRVSNSFISY